jgi:hypothetical protein
LAAAGQFGLDLAKMIGAERITQPDQETSDRRQLGCQLRRPRDLPYSLTTCAQ